MSKEEAIKELTELLPEEFLSEYANAIKMGIEALEQEPCENCISLNAVLNLFNKPYGNSWEIRSLLKRKIEELPQPKIGRWKRINKEKYVQHAMSYYRCSECGKEIIGTHNYCPNCGRKMQEVEE